VERSGVTTPTPFRYYLRVRYAECDAQKVVFHSRYAEYTDVAINEFFRALGFSAAVPHRIRHGVTENNCHRDTGSQRNNRISVTQ
jgi:acyl-CoA thioesterase FadM